MYFAALLVENEIQDFFGLRFEGLLVDYRGMLYLEEEALKTPYCRFSLRTAPPSAVQAEPADSRTAPGPDESNLTTSGGPAQDKMNP